MTGMRAGIELVREQAPHIQDARQRGRAHLLIATMEKRVREVAL